MKTVITPGIKEVMQAMHYRPAVSIIMPFEPNMSLKKALTYSLKNAIDKVEEELLENYPDGMGMLVIQKLKTIVKGLNFNTYKKSIAIYVSPVFEKVLYLDIQVEEKIIINDSFDIRDLVYNKKQLQKYLVLVLSGNERQIYIGSPGSLVRIVTNAPESVYNYANDVPEKVANFSDKSKRKEIVIDKFLKHIDDSLDIIINAYHLPLLVLAPERIIGHFKNLSRHRKSIIDYIHGNFEDASLEELKEVLKPSVAEWKKVKQKDLLNQMEDAAGKKKLAVGITNVWREAMHQKGRLLIMERNYQYPAQPESIHEVIYKAIEPYNKFSYIKDAVGHVMEKVLENGGDVEVVDDGLLKDYQGIVLIQHY